APPPRENVTVMKPLRLTSSRFRQPLAPASLRVLLLGALGSAVWACGGQTNECVAGDPACDGDNDGAGGSTDGASTGGSNAGGTTSDDGSTGGAASTGGASSGGAANTGGSGAGGSGGSAACNNPTPYVEGADTGIFRCEEGYLWRQAAMQCPSTLPRPDYVDWPTGDAPFTTSADECDQDADCQENATCVLRNTYPAGGCLQEPPPPVPDYERVCWAGCREDSDCAPSEVCLCGTDIGRCEAVSPIAGCHDDTDCEDGFLCLRNGAASPFSGFSFACQLPSDACTS